MVNEDKQNYFVKKNNKKISYILLLKILKPCWLIKRGKNLLDRKKIKIFIL
jgi:hypothetical protein